MALTKNEKGEHSTVTLEFTVARATFDAAVDAVFKEKSKDITIAGYRKGHAPRNLIEKMYGKGVFYEDALNKVLPDAYEEAIKEANIIPVGRPEFDVVSMDGDVVLSAKVAVKPELDIADYKGIEAVKAVAPVTDDEVAAEIKSVQERNSRETAVTDRAAALGDTVKFDFEGFIDDKAFEGGKGENYELKLGSGQFIPGFEDQICGHLVDDEFDVNVTFPEDYHAEELKGKPAVFKCKLHAINVIELPNLDDEFAKDVSEFDTYADYEADVRAKIQKRHETTADQDFENGILKALSEKLVADIPEDMYVAETENQLRDFDNRLRMQGMDLNQYTKYTGMDIEKMRGYFRPQAEAHVKTRLALEAVSAKEGLVVSDEEIEAEFNRMAEQYNMKAEEVKSMVSAEAVAEDLKVKKAMDFVKENAVALDKAPEAPAEAPAEETPAPKKKRTTKKAVKAEEAAE